MARYPLVNPATIVLTNPSAGGLLTAITAVQDAEDRFYRERRNLVNSYPMKTRDISASEIEALYDAHLGNEPWRYRNRFNNSGSTLRTGTYGNSGGGFLGGSSHAEHWVDNWGDTPASGTYPEIRNNAFLFDEERGAAWVDLIVKFGYNNGFSRRGSSRTSSVTSGAGDGASTTYYTIYEGFGVEPIAYNGRGGLSGFEAHMLKLVGDAYEDTVRSALNSYSGNLNDYQNGNGSPVQAGFDSNSVAQPWEGFTGTAGGYNRPNELVADLVRETRGTN
jgi:hypothetical protein